MTPEAMPAVSHDLAIGEREAMRQRQVKKHDVAIVLLHWFNATVWLIELMTGAALISSTRFAFMPQWYLEAARDAFGSGATLLRVHIAVGLIWIVVFLVYAVFGVRTYLTREVIRREIALDRDDARWLIVRVLGVLGRSNEPLPPQGVYNAGQKLFAMMVYAMVPVVMLTGLVMAFQLFGPAAVGWAVVLHFAAVGIVVSGLMIHVYMGAVFPEERPAFFSMITGSVNEYYAYHHHRKWWHEIELRRTARVAEHQEAEQAPREADQGPADGQASSDDSQK